MRIVTWRALLCVIVLGAFVAHSQTTPLIRVSDTPWRYYQEGNQPSNQSGLTWKDAAFDDAAWPTGLGVFGEETTQLPAPIQTRLWLTPPGGSNQVVTYYFRTHFNWTGGSNVFLWFTNLLDDGAVAYLNGTEIYRYRITGTPNYSTVPSGGPPIEGVYEVNRVFSNRIRAGDNVLTVEVHQLSGSVDVVFGLALAATIPENVAITRQPPSQIDAVERQDITFSVEATGSDLRYQWYRNNVSMSGQTNASLTLNNVVTSQAGTYHVLVNNVVSAVRSSNVVLRVALDTLSPRILSATVLAVDNNRFYLTFDEDILRFGPAPGTNVNNYIVTEAGTTNRLTVTNALVAIGSHMARITVAQQFDRAKAYELCVSSIADLRTNYIVLNSCVPIGFEVITNSFGYGQEWFYYDWNEPPPANWNQPDYIEDLNFWYEAPAMFYNQIGGSFNPPCTTHRWILTLGPTAYYFRKTFTVPADLVGLPITAVIGRVIDDGAIFYLNGTEISRTNMPAGAVAHDTLASSAGNPNVCATNQPAIGHLLRPTNVLTVEVHQNLQSDLDAAFDASLTLKYVRIPVLTNRPPAGDVFLRYSNDSPTHLRLYWTNGMGFALEYVTNFSDQWREVQPPSTNVLLENAGPTRFYRLNKRH